LDYRSITQPISHHPGRPVTKLDAGFAGSIGAVGRAAGRAGRQHRQVLVLGQQVDQVVVDALQLPEPALRKGALTPHDPLS